MRAVESIGVRDYLQAELLLGVRVQVPQSEVLSLFSLHLHLMLFDKLIKLLVDFTDELW